ncbi:hypothetical protein GLYMA_17G251850v4 [Glycine max]|nr:hypothetical protein GLYMA_17G251850v4 [Glycine max]
MVWLVGHHSLFSLLHLFGWYHLRIDMHSFLLVKKTCRVLFFFDTNTCRVLVVRSVKS